MRIRDVYYLYGLKPERKTGNLVHKLVATFDSEQQLRAYVRWATLSDEGEGRSKFEQGSVLSGHHQWQQAEQPRSEEEPEVPHNPSPTML